MKTQQEAQLMLVIKFFCETEVLHKAILIF